MTASDNSGFRGMSDKVFKANCNEHKAFMFFQDFLFFLKAALFFLSLPLGNITAMISKEVAHVHTRQTTPKDKSATKTSLPILILLQAEIKGVYYLCAQSEASCSIGCW